MEKLKIKWFFKCFIKRPNKRSFILLIKALFINFSCFIISIVTFKNIYDEIYTKN